MAPFSSFPYLQQYGWRRLSLSLSLGPVTSYPLRRRSFSLCHWWRQGHASPSRDVDVASSPIEQSSMEHRPLEARWSWHETISPRCELHDCTEHRRWISRRNGSMRVVRQTMAKIRRTVVCYEIILLCVTWSAGESYYENCYGWFISSNVPFFEMYICLSRGRHWEYHSSRIIYQRVCRRKVIVKR